MTTEGRSPSALAAITRDDWILGGLTLLLVLDLLALPWFSIAAGPFSLDFTAVDAPDGLFGVLAVLSGLVLIADLAVERLSPQTKLPAIGGSRATTRMALAAATAVFVALKFLFNIHFSEFGIGFWLGAILTAAVVALAMRGRAA